MSTVKEAKKGKNEEQEKEKPRITTRARARGSSNVNEISLNNPVSWPVSAQKKKGKRLIMPSSEEIHPPENSAADKAVELRNVSGDRDVLKWAASTPDTRDRKRFKASMTPKQKDFPTPIQSQKKSKKKSLQAVSDAVKSSDKSGMSNDLVCVVKMHHCDATPKGNARAASSQKSVQTPKESPKNLDTHRVHSMKPLQLSNTPRNLSHSLDSQKSLQKYSTPPSIMKERKSLSAGKSPPKRLSLDTKHVLRRFSKSPKIVLRSPKPKSKSKSKSPKLNVARKSYFSKDVGKRRSEGGKSKKEGGEKIKKPAGKENKEAGKSMSPMSVGASPKTVSPSITPRKARPLAPLQQYEDILSRKPVVLLQRISVVKNSNTKLDTSSSVRTGAKETDENSSEKGAGERMTRKRPDLLTDESSKGTEPLMSSTPYDEKKRSTRDSNVKERKSSPAGSRSNRSLPGANNTVNKSPATYEMNGDATLIENESEPSLCNLNSPELSKQQKSVSEPKTPSRRNSSRLRKESLVALTTVEQSPKKNVTYELLEPKTPSLREKSRKRSFHEASLTDLHSKKTPKVRFASAKMSSLKDFDDNIKERSEGPTAQSPSVTRVSNVRRSISLQNSKTGKGLMKPVSQPRIVIVTPTPTKASMTLGAKSVSGSKYSAAKKAPNFSRIHKKLFSQSESVLDAKRRLEERHKALTRTMHKTVSSAGNTSGISAGQSKNHFYNRFGFRLTKSDAANCITKKGQLQSREKQKQESREILKGVRMNRRFELQMRARKISTM